MKVKGKELKLSQVDKKLFDLIKNLKNKMTAVDTNDINENTE